MVNDLSTTFAIVSDKPNGTLTGPGTAGEEPVKSTRNRSSSIVTVTFMGIMSSETPSSSSRSSAVQEPFGSSWSALRASCSPCPRIRFTAASKVSRPNF